MYEINVQRLTDKIISMITLSCRIRFNFLSNFPVHVVPLEFDDRL